MGRKRREPSPPPPPPPEDESSSEGSSSAEEEEEEEAAEATPATQNSPKPPSAATAADADADSSDGSDEESSESGKIDAEAFELRQIASSSPPPAAASKLESDAGEPTPPGKAKKKGKSGAEKEAPELAPSGKAKKAKSGAAEKVSPELTPSSESKKKHKTAPWSKLEKPGQPRRWTAEDEIKILEALVRHVKANGTQPGAGELIVAVGGSLERKNCTKTEMYEKVRNIRQRYEKAVSTGALPEKDDDLRKFKLSEQVWGENAKQVAAATIAQNEVASLKSKKKGQTSKEKTEGHSKGGTAKDATTIATDENVGTSTERNKGQATEEKVDEDSKGRSSKKANTADTPAKSRKWGNHKEELEGDAKTGTTKETVDTTTQNGGTSVRSKSGKSDKERTDGDAESPTPKEDTANTRNGGTPALFKKEGETHEEKMDTDANVRGVHKGFDELQKLYPNLTSYVEDIQAQHPCGETLKRAFEFIDDDKACALESKIKKQRVSELRMEMRRADIKKEVTNIFIGLLN